MSLVLTPEGTPASPVEGEVYYDSTADKLKVRDASAFREVVSKNSSGEIEGTLSSSAVVPASIGGTHVLLEKYTADNSVGEKIFNLDLYSSYNTHVFVLSHLVPASDNVHLYCNLGTSSSSFANSEHDYSVGSMFVFYRASDNNNGRTHEISRSKFLYIPHVGNDSVLGLSGIHTVFGATNATQKTTHSHRLVSYQYQDHIQGHSGGGIKAVATDDAYIKYSFSGGYIHSGTITLYGIKDA